MSSLRALLLDVDGTLLDSVQAHAAAWVEALREDGVTVAVETVRPLVGMGGDKLLPAVSGIASDGEQGKRISERRGDIFRSRYLPHLRPFPMVRPLLEAFRERRLQLIVATSATKDDLGGLLERANIADLVDTCASGDTAKRSKPDPDIILAALRIGGVAAEHSLLLGDTPYDVEAAARAGLPSIGLRCGAWDETGLSGAIAVYRDPADLLQRLDESPIGRRTSGCRV
jgi:HAD superfamily hydrolase (TIGR01509 family)